MLSSLFNPLWRQGPHLRRLLQFVISTNLHIETDEKVGVKNVIKEEEQKLIQNDMTLSFIGNAFQNIICFHLRQDISVGQNNNASICLNLIECV